MAKDPAMGPVSVGQSSGQVGLANMPEPQLDVAEPTPIKVVIWAGGRGTRLHDVTKGVLPKPMIRVGDIPLLEHIMRSYAAQGFRDFIVAAGYLREVIEDWVVSHKKIGEFADNITVVDTGIDTQTGGRLARLSEHLEGTDLFLATYGDGLSDVNLVALLEFHRNLTHPTGLPMVTLTAANPPARFGNLVINNGYAVSFGEKTQVPDAWINSGFYVIDTGVLGLIPGDNSRFEYDILPILAVQHRLGAFQHPGYFQMCDTFRDFQILKQSWASGNPPWRRWG